jgi:hypothetical protein
MKFFVKTFSSLEKMPKKLKFSQNFAIFRFILRITDFTLNEFFTNSAAIFGTFWLTPNMLISISLALTAICASRLTLKIKKT